MYQHFKCARNRGRRYHQVEIFGCSPDTCVVVKGEAAADGEWNIRGEQPLENALVALIRLGSPEGLL